MCCNGYVPEFPSLTSVHGNIHSQEFVEPQTRFFFLSLSASQVSTATLAGPKYVRNLCWQGLILGLRPAVEWTVPLFPQNLKGGRKDRKSGWRWEERDQEEKGSGSS